MAVSFVTGAWLGPGAFGAGWKSLGRLLADGFKWMGATWAASGLLTPMPGQPKQGSYKPLYSLTGSQNNTSYDIPRLYGTMKMFPTIIPNVMPYTEIVGNDQFVNVLYCFGYGDLELDEDTLKIGDDLLRNYTDDTNDVTYEMGSGFTNTAAVATVVPESFSNTIYENQLNHLLVYDEWMQHQTKTGEDANEISVDVTFPYGLYGLDDDNNKTSRTVGFELEYKKVGEADWLPNSSAAVENLCPGLDE